MLPPSGLDPLAVRRQFARRADRLDGADFLLREVERQMLERLDVIRIEPEQILDIGCGLGNGLASLRRRYQQARAIGVDIAYPVLATARQRLAVPETSFFGRLLSGLGQRKPQHLADLVAADMAMLPLTDSSADLVWSNLCLHWVADPVTAIAECHRVIRPGGLLMFSTFGVDTFSELRRAGAGLMPFHDMHDIGDALVEAGFADPVMDMSMMTVSFGEPDRLLSDLHALGGNALVSRRPGLTGRAIHRQWVDRLLQMRDSDGQIRISFEVCFGHAWCPDPKRLPRGLSRVEFHPKTRD